MNDLPAPLVPAHVDLTKFPFMPLVIDRLKRSRAWLLCKRRPELAFYLVNAWTASWHAKPAGSLEDDDLVLADIAMCDEATWEEVRSIVLRGWVRCSDGRLYHPVVAELARDGWERKLAQCERTEKARIARAQKRASEAAAVTLPAQPEPSVTENATTSVTSSNRQGQGQGQQKEATSLRSVACAPEPSAIEPREPAKNRPAKPRRHPYPADAFATWYGKYPRKKARPVAEKVFHKIEAADDTPFATLLAGIDAFWRENPDVAFWPHPATWLNQRRWTDEPSATTRPSGTLGTEERINFGGGVSWPVPKVLRTIDEWRANPASWPEGTLGAPPGRPGCKVPTDVLRMAA